MLNGLIVPAPAFGMDRMPVSVESARRRAAAAAMAGAGAPRSPRLRGCVDLACSDAAGGAIALVLAAPLSPGVAGGLDGAVRGRSTRSKASRGHGPRHVGGARGGGGRSRRSAHGRDLGSGSGSSRSASSGAGRGSDVAVRNRASRVAPPMVQLRPLPSQVLSTAVCASAVTGALAQSADLQIAEARRLRDLYRVPGGKQFICPHSLGCDPSNRDGIPLNGDRCDALLGDIEQMGWDDDEANFDCIAVQERPHSSDILRWNVHMCSSQEMLSDVVADEIRFGTLSHSHLNQCLKNILGSALASKPKSFIADGRLRLDLVALSQPRLADACSRGLHWEVLSWKLRDVPGALGLIQSACNRKGGVQLRETELQVVARLSHISCALAGKLTFDAAQAHLRRTMPVWADSADLVGLLRFVVTLGADSAPFLKDLKEFVGMRGQNRNVRSSLFAAVAALPPSIPHVMVGLVVAAYTAPPAFIVDGYSKFVTAQDVKMLLDKSTQLPVADAVESEGLLRFFYQTCKLSGVFDAVATGDRLDFLSSLSSCVCRFLLRKHMGSRHDQCPTVHHVVELFYVECAGLAGCGKLPQRCWATPAPVALARATAPAQAHLAPRVISFVDGEAIDAQSTFVAQRTSEQFDWQGASSDTVDGARCRLMFLLESLQTSLPKLAPDVFTIARTDTGRITVRANREFAAGELCLPPMVSGLGYITIEKDDRTSGPAVPGAAVRTGIAAPGGKLVILPCVRLPPRGVSAAAWDKPVYALPVWLAERSFVAVETNCSWVSVVADIVLSIGLAVPPLDVGRKVANDYLQHSIPVLTNHTAIKAGDHLVVICERDAPKAKHSKTWQWHDTVKRAKVDKPE